MTLKYIVMPGLWDLVNIDQLDVVRHEHVPAMKFTQSLGLLFPVYPSFDDPVIFLVILGLAVNVIGYHELTHSKRIMWQYGQAASPGARSRPIQIWSKIRGHTQSDILNKQITWPGSLLSGTSTLTKEAFQSFALLRHLYSRAARLAP